MTTDQLFFGAYFLLLIVASAIRKHYTKGWKRQKSSSPLPEKICQILVGIGMFVLPLVNALSPWLTFAHFEMNNLLLRIIGAALFIPGIAILYWSHKALGKFWSPDVEFKENQPLRTNGIYKKIRHPMYLAHLLWAASMPFYFTNYITGFAMLIAASCFTFLRITREEKLLKVQFGTQFETYKKASWLLIPGIL